jgi:1-acyl-sn-glycerol-3-phosphate acyltransferase
MGKKDKRRRERKDNPRISDFPEPREPSWLDARPEAETAPADDAPSSPDADDAAVPSFESDGDTADVAPVGPTEYAGPSSQPSLRPQQLSQRPAGASGASVADLEQQIRDLEAKLDSMIGAQARAADGRGGAAPQPSESPAPAARTAEAEKTAAAPSNITARDVLSRDFYLRQWGRTSMRKRSEEVDDFGLDPAYEARFLPALDLLYKRYFRVETTGAERIPDAGRCLVVANHSGGPLPYDGIMLRTALRREHPGQRELRWLAEDFIYYLPFVGTVMNRLGAVRACQENAERLLSKESLVAVFPEGAKGIGKLYRDRYKLQRFGRGGFIRLCLRTDTPIVPCAIVGAEEANPLLHRVEVMAKALGVPYVPITPTFPALGPLGLLPAPTKWKIVFGEPIRLDAYGPEAADDEILVGRLAERVRSAIQELLDETLSRRRSIWFG